MASSVHPRLLNLSNNEVIQITTEKILVGRSLKADYVISGQAISRIHFSIEKANGVWAIHDHSTNGTCVNNTVIKSRSKTLKTGDMIRFVEGSVSLKFELPSNPSPTTNSEPNPDFIVSVTNGDDVPSVSNDHSYERREELRPEPEIVVDLTSPEGSPGTSGAPKAAKRSLPAGDEEVPSKKNKLLDESLDQSKIQCVLESSDLECSICQELFIKAATLNCSHSFCSSCIHRWKNQRNHCPICRRPIESVNPSMILDNIVKKLEGVMDIKSRERREISIKERTEAENTSPQCNYERYRQRFFQSMELPFLGFLLQDLA
ncbi:E3 ubiquitin-protein ligase CHFR-like isoform X2 [Coccinella septempunctata]|uniref:E3 ubiquitin-protein ligase CHFR-like isoform X2 n=1 Tax=Coccinella septempunctata TaxID=41139 RepID=UPI001D060BB5|nr:E3 ubiquitin-protein ligase CHFR-like isoform X2 [Coccinella septempunctata]